MDCELLKEKMVMEYSKIINDNWGKVPFTSICMTRNLVEKAIDLQCEGVTLRANIMSYDRRMNEAVLRQTLLNAQLQQRLLSKLQRHIINTMKKHNIEP